MQNTIAKFDEILDTLDKWKIRSSDLREVIDGTRTLSREGAIAWSHLAIAFNREAYPLISEQTRTTPGCPW